MVIFNIGANIGDYAKENIENISIISIEAFTIRSNLLCSAVEDYI